MKTQSNQARNMILQDLRAHSKIWTSGYESVSSVVDYFVQVDEAHLLSEFSARLQDLAGECVVCDSEEDAYKHIAHIIEQKAVYVIEPELISACEKYAIPTELDDEFSKECRFALTGCDALSVRSASVVLTSHTLQGRRTISAPEIHFVIAYENQIVADLPEALQEVSIADSSQITVITGPSRTADIEKTLVLGAHGPKRLCVCVIRNNE
jgi:L-lactate dehydrogenase complex protein LldG